MSMEKKPRRSNVGIYTAMFIIGVLSVVLVVLLFGITEFDMTIVHCSSNSMYPALHCNCIVLLKRIRRTTDIQQGDIISYRIVVNGEYQNILHRVNSTGDGAWLTAKGDNNGDVTELVSYDQVRAKMIAKLCPPYGWVSGFIGDKGKNG